MEGVVRAWGKILAGHNPLLSIEITRECPLRCPGCYAYGDDHLGGTVTLRQVNDLKGQALVQGVLDLIDEHKPLHVSLIGGEPLVRYRELNDLLPALSRKGIHTQLVTSAVRPIPLEWSTIPRFEISVSIDGLQPEHDERRSPATYERILKHIEGHHVTVHCTVTHQQVSREGYLEDFVKFWSAVPAAKRIWMSLFTPQVGETSMEILTPEDRKRVIAELLDLRTRYPKLAMPKSLIEVYANPPETPQECIFSRVTTCVSADLQKTITPCQFGGTPDCKNCGCMASAGFAAIGRHQLPIGIRVGHIFEASFRVGASMKWIRETLTRPARETTIPGKVSA